MIDVDTVKSDFPILQTTMNEEPLVYLDNAATTQKPQVVLEAINQYYMQENANIYRGIYQIAEKTTEKFETVRKQVSTFVNSASEREIIFTKGTTQALNWIAQGYFLDKIHPGDEIVLSYLEHHSNLIPWQQLAQKTGATLKFIPLNEDGDLDLMAAKEIINSQTALVAITHVSNVLGVVTPIAELSRLAHENNALIVVDGAQSVPHHQLDVRKLDIDFLAFSGHKMLAPTGIGVLYGKMEYLKEMRPIEFGGEMISKVGLTEATFKPIPWCFEAGTQHIAGVIGLGAALTYLTNIGMDNIETYEQELTSYALEKLSSISGIEIYGEKAKHKSSIISFNLTGIHAHDAATVLDLQGIALRAGHHCAQPLMKYLQIQASLRVSFYFYNTKQDVDRLVTALLKTKEYFENGII
ncbi:cysteine desulfurase [Ligilactobacillus ceti]|uniref:Cysteine desulfurase n=1 Tax=Ligilactobacillus ceti DSM 22408 TaxID=1122146 RepID=A0A0R2KHX8_9LACO|nr:cysteine desulfurase [Ligilactobacillus ceti]KRN88992.1 selenocysteine lyase, cysteine desulfurase [Ligilactobacillus ceti DSM 22408]